jgi:dynein heavy chain
VQEVHAACEDVLAMVAAWAPSGGAAPLAPAAAASFRAHCASLLQEAVLTATKAALGALQERLEGGGGGGAGAEGPATPDPGEGLTPPVAAAGGPGPLLSLELQLEGGGIVLRPGLDALQACIAAAAAAVLRAGEELPGWAALPAGGGLHGAELRAAAATVERAAEGTQGGVARQLALFEPFAFLWRSSLQAAFADFQRGRPSLEESEAQLRRLQRIALDLEALPASLPAGGALALDPSPLKHALAAEAAAWKAQFASRLHAGALAELRRLEQEGRALAARLARRVEDLEDVRAVLGALEAAREAEAEFERAAAPVEEMYALLARHEVRVPKEEADALGDLQYQYRGLRRATADAGARLAGAQARLLGEVRAGAGALAADAKAFRAHWDAAGPAVPGLLPAEAAARLQTFKAEFEARQRRWDKVAAGEALFGLPPTPLPELQQTQEDVAALDQLYRCAAGCLSLPFPSLSLSLTLLQQQQQLSYTCARLSPFSFPSAIPVSSAPLSPLRSLYTAVLAATRDHGALPWAQAVAQFDALGARVADFQAQARRVPRALREWPAYRDCRRAVDDLAAAVPLLQGLGRPAVRARHWAELVRVLGAPLPAPGEGLTLGQALAAPLAAHRDAVEELCAAAAKEEGVERKLRAVADQWAGEALAFAEHKQRGAVLLRPAETAELMERLEDSTMALGGLSANRFAAPFRAELQAWSAKLGAVGEVMERWLAVQAMWAYMEAVFAGGDIVRQLPAEAKRFQGIDRAFVKLVAGAREAGRVLDACCGSDALRAALPHLLEQLELCQKSLAAYLGAPPDAAACPPAAAHAAFKL